MKDGFKARVEAFFKEFPFLGWQKINPEYLDEPPKIQRVDLDLIDEYGWTPEYYRENNMRSCGGIVSRYFILLRKDGSEIGKIQQYDFTEKKRVGFLKWEKEKIKGDTVYEGICKLENPDDVFYILEVKDLWSRGDGYSQSVKYGLFVTLHKIPTGRTFSKWISEIGQIASEELKTALAEVDNV